MSESRFDSVVEVEVEAVGERLREGEESDEGEAERVEVRSEARSSESVEVILPIR